MGGEMRFLYGKSPPSSGGQNGNIGKEAMPIIWKWGELYYLYSGRNRYYYKYNLRWRNQRSLRSAIRTDTTWRTNRKLIWWENLFLCDCQLKVGISSCHSSQWNAVQWPRSKSCFRRSSCQKIPWFVHLMASSMIHSISREPHRIGCRRCRYQCRRRFHYFFRKNYK